MGQAKTKGTFDERRSLAITRRTQQLEQEARATLASPKRTPARSTPLSLVTSLIMANAFLFKPNRF